MIELVQTEVRPESFTTYELGQVVQHLRFVPVRAWKHTSNEQCPRCKKSKPSDQFHQDGVHGEICNECNDRVLRLRARL